MADPFGMKLLDSLSSNTTKFILLSGCDTLTKPTQMYATVFLAYSYAVIFSLPFKLRFVVNNRAFLEPQISMDIFFVVYMAGIVELTVRFSCCIYSPQKKKNLLFGWVLISPVRILKGVIIIILLFCLLYFELVPYFNYIFTTYILLYILMLELGDTRFGDSNPKSFSKFYPYLELIRCHHFTVFISQKPLSSLRSIMSVVCPSLSHLTLLTIVYGIRFVN